MRRCSKCDKSDHTHCKRGICECMCQDYFKAKWNEKLPEERKPNPEHDKFFDDKMKEWRELHKPLEKK